MFRDPWYEEIADRFGEEYAELAGGFPETRPWTVPYQDVFDLPSFQTVIQFSGAFHPLHEGHVESIQNAINALWKMLRNTRIHLVLHADHDEYRSSKGAFSTEKIEESFKLLDGLRQGLPVPYTIVREDAMPNGCSRNFTRLYSELTQRGNDVFFLSGGDRANYALSFRERGACIISGRSSHPLFQKYQFLHDGDRILFIEGDNPAASSIIRAK